MKATHNWVLNGCGLGSPGGAWRFVMVPLGLCVLLLTGGGCSARKYALNRMGDALASSGTTFASDNDPQLVRDAAPFSLKLMESVLSEVPRHTGLLLATSSGFTQYAYAFVHQEADELEQDDFAAAMVLRKRAAALYLRAKDYGLRGLSVRFPGFESALHADPVRAVQAARRKDVPLLYWTAAAWGSAISLSKDQPARVAEVPAVEAMIDRCLELDEAYEQGVIHSFLISYEMSRQGAPGIPEERARLHFERALELSAGVQAAPLVALAEAVCVQKQDVKEFDALLERALAIDPDQAPEVRLVNLVMQRRARWLVSRREELFLISDQELK
jgi:predicted anti-sigma-YlaC factor YlaD